MEDAWEYAKQVSVTSIGRYHGETGADRRNSFLVSAWENRNNYHIGHAYVLSYDKDCQKWIC
ncbi:MAG: hypothetical protein ACLRYY_02055 [Anaerobutyricum soehngenii]